MNQPPLDELYFNWLYSQVGSVTNRNMAQSYWKLLRLLYGKEFTWDNIEKDGNRAQDGKDLRLRFLEETGAAVDEDGWLDMSCSFLEMLVALSMQVSFETLDETSTTASCFWEILGNLGLAENTDAYPADPDYVECVMDRVIYRTYEPDGRGGLFPLAHASTDQRQVELWYQANTYLLERL